jgi:hypothetical protein
MENYKYITVYHIQALKDKQFAIVHANIPFENLEKAKEIYNEELYILRPHNTKENVRVVN